MLIIVVSLLMPPGNAQAAVIEKWGMNDTIPFSKYFVQNNQWGKQYNGWGDGSQSIRHDTNDDGIGAWSTNFNWWNVLSDDPWHIKAWPSIVCGWQWGTWSNNSGLPLRLWDNKNVYTTWHFSPNGGSYYKANGMYDLWLHQEGDMYWPTDEIMIWPWWTDEETGAHSGQYLGSYYTNGANWSLYKGWVSDSRSPRGGWTFWKFVRDSKTTQVNDLNIGSFLGHLQWGIPASVGRVPNSRFLTSIQASSEIWYGQGSFSTSRFSVSIQ